MFLGSIFVAWIVLTVISVVAFGTFCLSCLGAAGLTSFGSGDESMVFIIAGATTLAAVSGVGYLMFRWIRSRWHQDLRK